MQCYFQANHVIWHEAILELKKLKMKSRVIMSLAAVLVLTVLSGCYKDIISPGQDPNGPPQFVSFSGDLVPIFTANCAVSGCHDGTAHNPDLRADKAYNAITNG